MKNMGKKIRYIAFFIGVCVLLAGCGKKFDASGYTKAVLDVSYKNEIQKYVELTGADEKEADKIFEDNLESATINWTDFLRAYTINPYEERNFNYVREKTT